MPKVSRMMREGLRMSPMILCVGQAMTLKDDYQRADSSRAFNITMSEPHPDNSMSCEENSVFLSWSLHTIRLDRSISEHEAHFRHFRGRSRDAICMFYAGDLGTHRGGSWRAETSSRRFLANGSSFGGEPGSRMNLDRWPQIAFDFCPQRSKIRR
ncbi:hypothetical protein BDV12DRAFT_53483 [Aspergillus spectabilis]